VVRDDRNKTIIISICGTTSAAHAVLNVLSLFSPNQIIPECPGCRAHWGFQIASERVLDAISAQVAEQVAAFPEYRLLITGHSLGGAIGALLVITSVKILCLIIGHPLLSGCERSVGGDIWTTKIWE